MYPVDLLHLLGVEGVALEDAEILDVDLEAGAG
jgi:hypothetical protein